MVEVLSFIFESPLHYFGTLLFLAVIGYAITGFKPISISNNHYHVVPDMFSDSDTEEE